MSTSNKITLKAVSSAIALAIVSMPSQANVTETVAEGIKGGETQLSFRYRYETVDQDGITKDAKASTLKSRITYKSAAFYQLVATIEADNVTNLGAESYNSTTNGNSQYPVVADPLGTDLNQANLTYTGLKDGKLVVGRQRIVVGDQRFVGGVAWRQNEQTYDALRLNKQLAGIDIDLGYLWKVQRIFGDDSANGTFNGDIVLATASYKLGEAGKLTVFDYYLDLDDAVGLSTNTLGIEYMGSYELSRTNTGKLSTKLRYARQSDTGDNPASFDADYLAAELGVGFSPVSLTLGYELLGSDNGKGFSTPLATLHKFNGFADKFLATPADGLQDIYLKAATKLGKLKLAAIYHDFESDQGSSDLGDEIDLVASMPFNKQLSGLLKYADYSAGDSGADTQKAWLMLTAKF